MRHRFADECSCDDHAFNEASLQELDVYFIVQPNDVAVGYVVFRQVANLFCRRKSPDPRVDDLLMLSEVYVEPRYRRKGMAAAALRVLLAGRPSVAISEAVVDAPARALCIRLLLQLGFKEQGRTLFTRGTALKTVQDENAI
jgi:GNAT superfamily N-acetyltransferase